MATYEPHMMAFSPEHPKWDQNLKFTPLSETTSIPTPFIYKFSVPTPGTKLPVLLQCSYPLTQCRGDCDRLAFYQGGVVMLQVTAAINATGMEVLALVGWGTWAKCTFTLKFLLVFTIKYVVKVAFIKHSPIIIRQSITRYVQDWILMRFKFLMISITKCPYW